MVIHRLTIKKDEAGKPVSFHEGWYLFGFIPLYVRQS
jgi:hypothetical protein